MNVVTHALLLTGYATTVAICAPRVLSRSSVPERSPRLALALWHTSAGSAGFAIGLAAAKLVSAARFLPDDRTASPRQAVSFTENLLPAMAGLLIAIYVSAVLVRATAKLLRSHRHTRDRHVDLLTVLGHHDPDLDATVIPATTAAAYCVAGTRKVVVTDQAVRLLESRQLAAVLAHERAHLDGRHHLLVGWATLLVAAFPRISALARLREATLNLVELLADDKARRLVDGRSLAAAIALLGPDTPNSSLAATGGQALARVERLLDPPPQQSARASLAIAALAPLLVGLPLLLASFPADMLF